MSSPLQASLSGAQNSSIAIGGGANSQHQQKSTSNDNAQQHGSAAGLLLDGDGILTQLFYFLWRMKVNAVAAAGGGNVSTGTYNPAKPPKSDDPAIQAVMDLCIPSTVILEHNFPKFWYAKSGDFDEDDVATNRSSAMSSAPLERRTGRDIDSAAVCRAFRVPEGSSAAQVPASGDIVASYYAEATDEEGRACTRVEFLDAEGVKGLLIRRTRRPDGILQCWISPSGKSNNVIQVIWSPHVTHVTKRQNRFALRDTRLPLYDRAVTFEGLAHYSDEVFVAPHIKSQTKLVCDELVRHFRDVHRVTVSRMVLYFKTDTAGRLWFLFGNSLRTSQIKGRHVSLSLRGMKPQERIDAENNQSSRMARMLIDEAYEVKAAHQAHSKMEDYANAHKRIRQAAKEEPLIRSLIGTQIPPYANLRPKPPSLGPIGDTYYPNPRKITSPSSKSKHSDKDGGDKQNTSDDGGEKENENYIPNLIPGGGDGSGNHPNSRNDANHMLNNNVNPVGENAPGSNGAIISSPFASMMSPSAAAAASKKSVNLSRLVAKVKTAQAMGKGLPTTSPNRGKTSMLTSSLACVIPPLFGPTGTLQGGSFAMFETFSTTPANTTLYRNVTYNNNVAAVPASPLSPNQLLQQTENVEMSSLDRTMSSAASPLTLQLQQSELMVSTFGNLRTQQASTLNSSNHLVQSQSQDYQHQQHRGGGSGSGRSGAILWQIVKLAVRCGATKSVAFRPELREFIKGMMYGLYSHFSSENATQKMISNNNHKTRKSKPFRIVIPRVYFEALNREYDTKMDQPASQQQQNQNQIRKSGTSNAGAEKVEKPENWWDDLGFSRVRVVKVSEVHLLLPPPPSKQRRSARLGESQTQLSVERKTEYLMQQKLLQQMQPVSGSLSPQPPEEDLLGQTRQNLENDVLQQNNQQQEQQSGDDEEGDELHQQHDADVEAEAALEKEEQQKQIEAQAAVVEEDDNNSGSPFHPILFSNSKKDPQLISPIVPKPEDASPTHLVASVVSPSPAAAVLTNVAPKLPSKKNNNNDGKKTPSIVEVPINSHPHDVVLEVASLSAPLLHVQAQMEKLIRQKVDLPSAKTRFFYAAHRVIMERRRTKRFADVVHQTIKKNKGFGF